MQGTEISSLDLSFYNRASKDPTDAKFLESFKSIKPSDFEISFSGFSENKSMSQVPKEKVQKTLFFHSASKVQDPKNEIEFSAEKVIENIEKKRASFNYMKKWDDYQKQVNCIYRNLVEKIMNFLLDLGSCSLETYSSFIRFLKDKAIQEKNFSISSFNNEQLGNEKFKTTEIFSCFNELGLIENEERKVHFEFATFIERDLIQQKLAQSQTKYLAFYEHFKKNELKTRQNLNKMFLIMNEKFEQYATVFSEIMRFYLTSNKLLGKDLLVIENLYLYAVIENFNILKFYSKQMKENWYCLKKIEFERVKEFSVIINQFLEKEEKIYQLFPACQDQFNNIMEKLKIFDPESHIISLFDLNKIMASDQIQYLNKRHKIEHCSEEIIFKFFENYQLKPISFRPLIVADINILEKDESNAQKYSVKDTSLWKEGRAIVSVDMNMLVLEDNSVFCFKPKKIIRLPLCTCLYNEEIYHATISEIKSTVLSMNNVEKHYFKFKGAAELNDFKECVNKYIRNI